MRLVGWLGPALLAVGCWSAEVDPAPDDRGGDARHAAEPESNPASAMDTGDSSMSDRGSVPDEPALPDLGDTAEDGCRKLVPLGGLAPADDSVSLFEPPSSVPDSPLQLEVEYEQGFAVVTVRGPQIFLDKVTSCKSIWGGYGYTINWGDGTPERGVGQRDCTTDLRHEFHLAGTFEVRASTFHPGPIDAPVFDSRHAARLVIDPARLPPDKPLRLSLVDEDRTFRYRSGPSLQYTVQKNRALYLCVELRSETGVIGNSELMPIRNHVTAVLHSNEYFQFGERYQAALRAGQSKFQARAFLFDGSKQPLEQAVTESFRMTQLHSEQKHTASFAIDGLNVTMTLPTYEPSCLQLDIDWGDGTERTQRLLDWIPRVCLVEDVTMSFSHTYAAPGSYEVLLRSTEHDHSTALKDVLGYCSYRVTAETPGP